MTKIRTPSPLAEASSRLHPSILPAGNPIQRATAQRKPRRPLSEEEVRQRAEEREEMQSLLSKLKQLVPGIPKRRKLSKLEIIQHVIDYIFDLQVALESHPINSNANQAAVTSAAMEFLNFQISQQQHQNPESYQQTESSSNTSTPCDLAYQMIYQSQHEPIRIVNQAPPRTERQPLASIML